MRRVVSTVTAIEKGATYRGGGKPAVAKTFDDVCTLIEELKSMPNIDEGVLETCNSILSQLDNYHQTVIEEIRMVGLNIKGIKPTDMSGISEKLDILLVEPKPKEWLFDVEYDNRGRPSEVKATEVI